MRSSQILYIFLLHAVKITIFGSKMVVFPRDARNANIYKICEFNGAIFSSFKQHLATKHCNFTHFRSSCLDQPLALFAFLNKSYGPCIP